MSFVRTADAMFLHSRYFLKCEPGCIHHEGEFRKVDLLDGIALYGNDEKNEKN